MQNQKPPIGTGIDWSNPLSQGLKGAWLLNEASGNKTYNIVSSVPSTVNATAKLDGSGMTSTGLAFYCGAYAPISEFTWLTGATAFTASVSFIKTGTSANSETLISKDANSLVMQYDTSNARFYTCIGGLTPNAQYLSKTISLNTLYTLTTTVGNGYYTVYLNGKPLAAPVAVTGALTVRSNYSFTIGADPAYYPVNGSILNSMLWNRALSVQEVQQLHDNPYQISKTPQQFLPASRTVDASKNLFRMS
jgi:hypothetical protein